jgi:acetolactate decarboxylase
MMHKGDISAKISLSELKDKPNLYALGAVENLKGEIQVFDGEPLIAFASKGKLSFDTSFDKKATLLVYTQVPEWKELTISNTITSYEQLETFIRESAEKNGLDVEEPFPFLISGKAKSLDWHVIDWKEGDAEHTHKKHIESGPHGTLTDTDIEILGFYSNKHHAIFTHHSTNMHLHFITKDRSIAGHLDGLELGRNMFLKLPRDK